MLPTLLELVLLFNHNWNIGNINLYSKPSSLQEIFKITSFKCLMVHCSLLTILIDFQLKWQSFRFCPLSGCFAVIKVVIPNVRKDINLDLIQKNNEQMKALLETVISENKRLEDVITQMMKEITFLREALLSTVGKLTLGW